jgi:hypothetical protein
MFSIRFAIGLLFLSALCFTTASGRCAEQTLDQQIAERTKQYQESLRQRAAQLSPTLQVKIEAQAQQTIAKCTEKWKSGKIDIRIALPQWAEAQRIARFVARHTPFSGSPGGSFEFDIGTSAVALTVTSVQSVLKSFAISVIDSVAVRSFVGLFHRNNDDVSYFIRVVCTIVLRR